MHTEAPQRGRGRKNKANQVVNQAPNKAYEVVDQAPIRRPWDKPSPETVGDPVRAEPPGREGVSNRGNEVVAQRPIPRLWGKPSPDGEAPRADRGRNRAGDEKPWEKPSLVLVSLCVYVCVQERIRKKRGTPRFFLCALGVCVCVWVGGRAGVCACVRSCPVSIAYAVQLIETLPSLSPTPTESRYRTDFPHPDEWMVHSHCHRGDLKVPPIHHCSEGHTGLTSSQTRTYEETLSFWTATLLSRVTSNPHREVRTSRKIWC